MQVRETSLPKCLPFDSIVDFCFHILLNIQFLCVLFFLSADDAACFHFAGTSERVEVKFVKSRLVLQENFSSFVKTNCVVREIELGSF